MNISLAKNYENKYIKSIIDILPGLLVSILVALVSILLSHALPKLGATTIAIFLGIALGNTLLNQKSLQAGYKFAETNLLAYSIVLLGATLSISAILKLGVNGILFIVLQMSITIGAALFIGKKLGFGNDFRYLMASGNAVCGSSAIVATASAINASDDDKGISIAIVNFTGVILMLLFPVLTGLFYKHELIKTSAMIGGTLQSIGQVVASGAMVSEAVKDLSTIFKILRVILLVVVVMVFSNLKNKSEKASNTSKSEDTVQPKKKVTVPWYVIGFFICCILFSLNLIPKYVSHSAKAISSNLEIIALAAIGLKINFKKLIQHGKTVSLYGILIGTVQIISAVILIGILL